jgi:catechol 2,3-dioxygenase-like lactoylglutathione lyase family enzyme
MPDLSLTHVALTARDLDTSITFYLLELSFGQEVGLAVAAAKT